MASRDDTLRGRVAWVTGSSRGLGRAIAAHLASLGASVVVHGTTPTSSRVFDDGDSLAAVDDAIPTDYGVLTVRGHRDLNFAVSVDGVVGGSCADVRRFGT